MIDKAMTNKTERGNMNQEAIIGELVAAFLGLAGLLGVLFRWLINSISQKLDRAVEAIERLTEKISLLTSEQQRLQREIIDIERTKNIQETQISKINKE